MQPDSEPVKTTLQPLSGRLGDMDIRLLRIFKAVVECGGFSAAEVQLNISRSAISISMADLEQRLGLRLCQRGRAGFALTEEGRQVHEAALQLFASLDGFRTQVNAIHAELRGELNIGITDNLVTMQHMRITDALTRLKRRGPGIHIHISMLPPNEIELRVLDGRLHIGVVPDLRTLAGLDYLPLYGEDSQLYCSDSHPLFGLPAPTASEILAQDACGASLCTDGGHQSPTPPAQGQRHSHRPGGHRLSDHDRLLYRIPAHPFCRALALPGENACPAGANDELCHPLLGHHPTRRTR